MWEEKGTKLKKYTKDSKGEFLMIEYNILEVKLWQGMNIQAIGSVI